MTRIFICLFIFLVMSCSKDDQKVEIDGFLFFKSTINSENYQTNGYKYSNNTGHNGPQIWMRKMQGDSLYINVSIQQFSASFPPNQVGNIDAYFYLVKKGANFEGSYALDKINYSGNYLLPGASNALYIDTTATFNFTVTDTSTHQPHGAYAEGSYNFKVLQNGISQPVNGSFKLMIAP